MHKSGSLRKDEKKTEEGHKTTPKSNFSFLVSAHSVSRLFSVIRFNLCFLLAVLASVYVPLCPTNGFAKNQPP
jgi:hypothetical protein